jgi:hypothetical protein
MVGIGRGEEPEVSCPFRVCTSASSTDSSLTRVIVLLTADRKEVCLLAMGFTYVLSWLMRTARLVERLY